MGQFIVDKIGQCDANNVAEVLQLIETHRSDVAFTDALKAMALYRAVQKKLTTVAVKLIEIGTDVNATVLTGNTELLQQETPFSAAISYDYFEIIEHMLEKNGNLSCMLESGQTLLGYALARFSTSDQLGPLLKKRLVDQEMANIRAEFPVLTDINKNNVHGHNTPINESS